MACTRYFLGGNTAAGFCSFYSSFCAEPEDFIWVLKGGPGCGKSSFMKTVGRAAEDAGMDVEYVLCSGDPESVDGVYLPAVHTGYVDGTAPHVLEVQTPGAGGSYLDLGQFYDRAALAEKRAALESLFCAYRACYAQAYGALARLRAPEWPVSGDACRRRRFLRALTCRGLVCAAQAGLRARTASPEELVELLRAPDAVSIRHPVFPELTEGVQTAEGCFLLDRELSPDTDEAVLHLRQAKRLHDELESIYNPHVDFSGLYALAHAHAARATRENPVVMRGKV